MLFFFHYSKKGAKWISIATPKKPKRLSRELQKLGVRFNHQQIDVEHLLLALLDQEKGLAAAILNKAGVSLDAVMVRARQRELEKLPRVTGAGLPTASTSAAA